jgi:hypothetical protein
VNDDNFRRMRSEAGAARWAVWRRVALAAFATLAGACGDTGHVFWTKSQDKGPQGAAPLCTQTEFRANMAITTFGPDGTMTSPDENYELATWGHVFDVSTTAFRLENCTGGDVDCSFFPSWEVDVFAPGLDLAEVLPEQALVELQFVRNCAWVGACTSTLIVKPPQPAPREAPSGLYVAVNDGDGSLPPSEFYSVDRIERHCRNFADTEACSPEGAGIYALQFHFTGHDEPVTVDMGQTVTAPLGAGEVRVENLRSYVTGRCDDDYNWAHVVTGVAR